jgi:hypothetical protein
MLLKAWPDCGTVKFIFQALSAHYFFWHSGHDQNNRHMSPWPKYSTSLLFRFNAFFLLAIFYIADNRRTFFGSELHTQKKEVNNIVHTGAVLFLSLASASNDQKSIFFFKSQVNKPSHTL